MSEATKVQYHYDVKNCVAFFGVKQDDGSIDYSQAEPVKLPGLRSFEASANGELKKIRADGIDYITVSSNNGYDLKLNFVMIDEAFKRSALGEKADAQGGQYEDADAEPAPFALVVEFKGSVKNKRTVFYNLTASRPNVAGENKDSMKDPDEEELDATASPLPAEVGTETVNLVKYSIDNTDDTATTWAKMLTEVVFPEAVTGGGGDNAQGAQNQQGDSTQGTQQGGGTNP